MSQSMRSALAGAAGVVLSLIPSLRAQVREEVLSVAGTVVSASVPPEQKNQHALRLRTRIFVRIAVEPHNCDLSVTFSESDGGPTRVLKTPYGTRNYISVSFVAAKDETATLAVATAKGTPTAGGYQIRVLEARPSEPMDQKAIQAQADFIEAESLKDGTQQDRSLAVEKLRSAAAGFRSIGRTDELGESLRQSARVLMDLNESPKAMPLLNEALALSKDRKSAADEASTLNLMGEADFNLGNMDRAESDFRTAVSMRESLGDLRGQVQSLNNLAVVYGENGDIAKALELHKRILPLRVKTGNRRGELETLVSLLVMYKDLGDIPNALDA